MAGNQPSAAASKLHGIEVIDGTGTSPIDDRLLVERVRSGDHAAYSELVERYADRLFAMLVHISGGDHDLAAEFTQEAFVRAFACLDKFAGYSSFYTWIYRLARNRALDLLAKKKPQARDLESLGRASPTAAPGDRIAGDEVQREVQRALARLPIEQRELLLMREFENLDYAQISAVLAIPEGTVKSRLNRARSALRDELSGRLGAEDCV